MVFCFSAGGGKKDSYGLNETERTKKTGKNRSYAVRDVRDQPLRFFPAQARVGNAAAETVSAHWLAAVLQIAFDHQAPHGFADAGVQGAAFQHIQGKINLPQGILSRIGMVHVHNDALARYIALIEGILYPQQILIAAVARVLSAAFLIARILPGR